MSAENPSFAQPDAKPAAVAPSMGSKNALLARIQAAKAKSQQTAVKPAPTADLLDFSAPAPAPAAAAPSDFDLLAGTPAPATPAATNNSSTFESLMATTTTPSPGPPSPELKPAPVVEAPAPAPAAPTIDDELLAALPPEEREALIRDQEQIMREIERKKAAAPKP
jgi:hypothetical protein